MVCSETEAVFPGVMRVSVLFSLLSVATPALGVGRHKLAPLFASRNSVPDGYIVKFKDGISSKGLDEPLASFVNNSRHVYEAAFRGFAATLDAGSIHTLRRHPDVEFIEEDAVFAISGFVEQKEAPWNLARVSHRRRGGSTGYVYDDSAGEGTCSYIIDTGIEASHPQFGGRAQNIKTFVNQTVDGHGHGTHLAGIVGSVAYGVAKKTKLLGVKCLDDQGSGTTSDVVAAMDFVAKDAKTRGCSKGVMANMSLGGGYSAAVNSAAAALVASGVFVSAAAGGSNTDAKQTSPASEPTVCTVGASTAGDERASYSNYGAVVDIFAPGSNILSTWLEGTTNTLSGSSVSAAHITGLGAYIAALEGSPGGETLCRRLQQLATKHVLTRVPPGTPNLLAFDGNPFESGLGGIEPTH
ncbi:subtilisin-like protease Pr1B [Metarhizium album ARSEF 1941]|uniref:Subtilisin-like protease Pr1B n=1 Tax=Metarhizium album (strain ARSEF 1941) TaxID=1081103 RepID=A0A0B2WM28_METAS|nr:subtilisin-like protease Pr1B [Metarhizium album ARSEF 1941]KHN94547.1 subtilisin-like protease Pr1B [Metarhizium album ARSEF 1941]